MGDIHGCYDTLERLLDAVDLDLDTDQLWTVGDLVNKGPSSLATLRWAHRRAQAMGPRFQTVLGNHDLHLLACFEGLAKPSGNDTFRDVLDAPDVDELLGWLAALPFAIGDGSHLLVHAGVHPKWSAAKALRRSQRLQSAMASRRRREILRRYPGPKEATRLQKDVSILTRIRTCTRKGRLHPFNGPPAKAPAGYRPWFEIPGRRTQDHTVLFGHWAALGLHLGDDVIGLDSGCVWGGALTAVRLSDRAVFQQQALAHEHIS